MFEILHEVSKVKPASTLCMQLYDVSRYELMKAFTEERTLSYSLHRGIVTYHLETSNLKFVQDLAKNSCTQIIDEDKYNIIWKTPRGRVLKETDTNSIWFLSYRKAKPEYNLPAYVLIWKKVY